MDPAIVSILAQVYASNARVAGMLAANQICVSENRPLQHPESDFEREASGLEHLAVSARLYQ